MNILHKIESDDIEAVVGEKTANQIILGREGKLKLQVFKTNVFNLNFIIFSCYFR